MIPGSFKKERNALETFRTRCEDDFESLQMRLQKIETTASLLKAAIDREEKGRVSIEDVLSSIRTWASETSQRIELLEEESAAAKTALSVLQDRSDLQSSYIFPYSAGHLDGAPPEVAKGPPHQASVLAGSPSPPFDSASITPPSSLSSLPLSSPSFSLPSSPPASLAEELLSGNTSKSRRVGGRDDEHQNEVSAHRGDSSESVRPRASASALAKGGIVTGKKSMIATEFFNLMLVLILVQHVVSGTSSR
ncbi:hypothetical protein BD414DRAFT_541102 [Trametes punicea]|nr:hypothetical protein BD414DRAFT_541102 [Trametes punicea]